MNDLSTSTALPALCSDQEDYILVDGSSSMQNKWWDSLDAIDGYVSELKRQGIDSHITLTTFCTHDLDLVQRDTTIREWKSLRDEPIGAHWGMTPLFDAIAVMGRKLRDKNPTRASIVIVTDGDENASDYTDDVRARAILDWMRSKGWAVTFIGAQFNNEDLARKLGAKPGESIAVSVQHLIDATQALARKRAAYGLAGTPMHYTEEEQQAFGGFLGHGG